MWQPLIFFTVILFVFTYGLLSGGRFLELFLKPKTVWKEAPFPLVGAVLTCVLVHALTQLPRGDPVSFSYEEAFRRASEQSEAREKAEARRAGALPVSDIQWGEVGRIYNLASDYTDLQKEEHWRNYKGKKVKWTGTVAVTVAEVSDSLGTQGFGDTLGLGIRMNADTVMFDLLIFLKETERSKALGFKQGDQATFTGILEDWGTLIMLEHGEIVQ